LHDDKVNEDIIRNVVMVLKNSILISIVNFSVVIVLRLLLTFPRFALGGESKDRIFR
jgi:hypothetical protein